MGGRPVKIRLAVYHWLSLKQKACLGIRFIMLTVEGPREPPVALQCLLGLGGAISVSLAWYGLWKFNHRWNETLVANFDSEPEKWLVHWTIPEETWKRFTEAEREKAVTNLINHSLIVGVVISFILLIPFWISSGFFPAVAWSAGLGFFVAILFAFVQFLTAMSQHHWRSKQASVEVWLRTDGMKINKRPICWTQPGSSLQSIRLNKTEESEIGMLEAVISRATYRQPVEQKHRVPVPPEFHEEVQEAIARCR